MIDASSFKALTDAFDEHTRAGGAPVHFWLRDDDATEPSELLDRLLELTTRFAVPVCLAVIPAHATQALASQLEGHWPVCVAVHGWSHQNHASANEKKQELGAHRELSTIRAELSTGFKQLSLQYRARFVPLLVPPWNRIDASVVATLSGIGFKVLSTFGDQSHDSIMMMNTHVDIIDWKGSRGGRDTDELVAELVMQLQRGTQPIGVLTHHLVHDEAAWQFLEALFAVVESHPDTSWVSVQDSL